MVAIVQVLSITVLCLLFISYVAQLRVIDSPHALVRT